LHSAWDEQLLQFDQAVYHTIEGVNPPPKKNKTKKNTHTHMHTQAN